MTPPSPTTCFECFLLAGCSPWRSNWWGCPGYEKASYGESWQSLSVQSSHSSQDPVNEICLDLQVKIADLGNACWVVSCTNNVHFLARVPEGPRSVAQFVCVCVFAWMRAYLFFGYISLSQIENNLIYKTVPAPSLQNLSCACFLYFSTPNNFWTTRQCSGLVSQRPLHRQDSFSNFAVLSFSAWWFYYPFLPLLELRSRSDKIGFQTQFWGI